MGGLHRWIGPALAAVVVVATQARADVRARMAVLDLTSAAQAETATEAPVIGVIAIVGRVVPAVPASAIATLVAEAAVNTGVPSDFLLRLLKRESGLNPMAVSPKGALGIAQFMPATAAERGLGDPFDPIQAIPKAAELLRDLRLRYGNWALAAAAYNAGPGRVDAWLQGRVELPRETVDYVASITGVNTSGLPAAPRLTGTAWPLRITALAAPLSPFGVIPDVSILRIPNRPEASLDLKKAERATEGAGAPLTKAQLRAAAGGVLRSAGGGGAGSPCAALLSSAAPCLNYSRY